MCGPVFDRMPERTKKFLKYVRTHNGDSITIILTGSNAIGPEGRNLCHATIFSVGCEENGEYNQFDLLNLNQFDSWIKYDTFNKRISILKKVMSVYHILVYLSIFWWISEVQ